MKLFGKFGLIKQITQEIKFFFQRAVKGYCDGDLWEINNWFSQTFPKMLREFSEVTLCYPPGFCSSDIVEDDKNTIRPHIINDSSDNEDTDEEYLAWKARINEMAELFEKTYTIGGWAPTKEAKECRDKALALLRTHYFDLWW